MSSSFLSAEDFQRLAVELDFKPFMGTLVFDTIFKAREGINRTLRKRRLPALKTIGFMVGGRISRDGIKALASQDDLLLVIRWMGPKSIQLVKAIDAQLRKESSLNERNAAVSRRPKEVRRGNRTSLPLRAPLQALQGAGEGAPPGSRKAGSGASRGVSLVQNTTQSIRS